uniref:Uncharacterized protein n=1 Tax=Arundo donax TaxID=35708 RepID=A0A0A9H4G7_ARUDO
MASIDSMLTFLCKRRMEITGST